MDTEPHEQRLALIRARQQRWRQERQAETDRQEVTDEIMRSIPEADTMGDGGQCRQTHVMVRPEEVIDRLTERIAHRLRDELRSELQRETETLAKRNEDSDKKLENYLASEIESHTCPICYDLMVPPDLSPTLLFPCGHTFCAKCLRAHISAHRRRSCPYCRTTIESQALNVSLQQLIQTFVARRDRRGRDSQHEMAQQSPKLGGIRPGPGPKVTERERQSRDSADAEEDSEGAYARQLRKVEIRCRILTNELLDSLAERQVAQGHLASVDSSLVALRTDEENASKKLEIARGELEKVQNLVRERQQTRRENENILGEVDARISLIKSTLSPLEQECDKLRLILQDLQGEDTSNV